MKNNNLSQKKLMAIHLLVSSNLSNLEICKKVKIESESTLYRWMKQPEFINELENQKQMYLNNLNNISTRYTTSLYETAWNKIDQLLNNSKSEKISYLIAKDLLTLSYRIEDKATKEELKQLAETLEKIQAFNEALPFIPKEVLKEFNIN